MLRRPGSSWGFGALLKDTSVVVLKEDTPPTSNPCRTWDSNPQPSAYKSDSLSIRKHQEKCAFSITEKHLSVCGVGLERDAGTSVPCSDRVDPHGSQESERRPVTHCQAVSETAGSDGSCVQCDTFWPSVHETPTVVAQDQGVLPEGKPASHDHGHAVMHTCLRHVAFSTQLEFLKGNISGYTCNHGSLRGTRRCVSVPYFRHPWEHLLHS